MQPGGTGSGAGSAFTWRCLACDARHDPRAVGVSCPACELDGALDAEFDTAALGRGFVAGVTARPAFDMWRYAALLPIAPTAATAPAATPGGTPLVRVPRPGGGAVWVKDDSRNPSGSLKDRASALAVALARAQGAPVVAAASTGNAAAALACMAAGTGLRCVIFAPSTAAREKLAQVRAYGAQVIEVEGGYDEAFAACHRRCREAGWYNRSTGLNSYMTEGKKTVAFEICEQLGWRAPDRVFVPVGNGCIVGAVWKGFAELHAMGVTRHVPRIVGVQAQGSDFLYRAWKAGGRVAGTAAVPPSTAASSIAVAFPRDRLKALRAITASGGEFVRVPDARIFEAVVSLAREAGIFAEPGAAAAWAGLDAVAPAGEDTTDVVLVTGAGLKDVGGLLRSGVLDRRLPSRTAAAA